MEARDRADERGRADRDTVSAIERFLSWEAAGGLTLIAAAAAAIAAVSAMAAPAAIYLAFNHAGSDLVGWAIPTATDIAFAVGILALLGTRAPSSLKLFLLALAIIDDLGAIIIIALFYTADLSTGSLALAGAAILLLIALNLAGCAHVAAYVLAGVFLWICVLKSGVHAT